MAFSSTITHPSKTVPGVRFTVHRMGFGRRTDLDFQTLSLRQRLRELEIDNPPDTPREKEINEQISIARRKALALAKEGIAELLAQKPDAVKVEVDRAEQAIIDAIVAADIAPLMDDLQAATPAETKKRRAVLNEEYVTIESRIREHWIRAGLVSIEHKVGTGECYDGMTAEQLLFGGPPELAVEIYRAIAGDGKLSGADSKNSSSPTTSGAPVGGEKTSSTAPNAEPLPSPTT